MYICLFLEHMRQLTIWLVSCQVERRFHRPGIELLTTRFGVGAFPLSFGTLGSSWTATDPFRGIYKVYLKIIKKIQKVTTCNWLDLKTLEFGPIMPKNLLGY